MLKKGNIHAGKKAFLLMLPLLLSLTLPFAAVGEAEAASDSLVLSESLGRGENEANAVDAPVIHSGSPAGPYGSGRAILNVTSIPEGAELFLADRLLGVTPWSGSDLPSGHFILRLRHSNYRMLEEMVELAADVTVNKSYTLVLGQGSLIVQTFPPGAKVFLDGHELKGSTPLSLGEVQAGLHSIKVHLDRYYDAEEKVAVAGDWVSRVKFDLKGGSLELCGGKWQEPEAAERCRAEEEARKHAALAGDFITVPGGCYQMGEERGRSDEKPVHEVCVDTFAIGRYEVTQRQWLAVMGKNPAYFKKGADFPVEQVAWPEAQNFITRLNEMTGGEFRLPSEAEWEYAARSGGKKELYAGGDNLEELAWYGGNAGSSTHPVGTKRPNGLGIYDMSGNVGEWVQDWYDSDYYKFSSRNNPVGPIGGCNGRVIRGGGWNISADLARAVNRDRYEPNNFFSAIGFRLAYSIK